MERIYEVDSDGYFHEDESEDIMDLDHAGVPKLLNTHHHNSSGYDEDITFEEYINQKLDDLEALDHEEIDAFLDEVDNGT